MLEIACPKTLNLEIPKPSSGDGKITGIEECEGSSGDAQQISQRRKLNTWGHLCLL